MSALRPLRHILWTTDPLSLVHRGHHTQEGLRQNFGRLVHDRHLLHLISIRTFTDRMMGTDVVVHRYKVLGTWDLYLCVPTQALMTWAKVEDVFQVAVAFRPQAYHQDQEHIGNPAGRAPNARRHMTDQQRLNRQTLATVALSLVVTGFRSKVSH